MSIKTIMGIACSIVFLVGTCTELSATIETPDDVPSNSDAKQFSRIWTGLKDKDIVINRVGLNETVLVYNGRYLKPLKRYRVNAAPLTPIELTQFEQLFKTFLDKLEAQQTKPFLYSKSSKRHSRTGKSVVILNREEPTYTEARYLASDLSIDFDFTLFYSDIYQRPGALTLLNPINFGKDIVTIVKKLIPSKNSKIKIDFDYVGLKVDFKATTINTGEVQKFQFYYWPDFHEPFTLITMQTKYHDSLESHYKALFTELVELIGSEEV